MEGYTPPITPNTGKIVCDTVFLNPVPFVKYWYIPMKTGVGDVTVRLIEVLLPNMTMMNIDKINTLPKSCKKRKATKVGAQRISNVDIDDLLEEIHKKRYVRYRVRYRI